MESKPCTGCGEVKPLTEFNRRASSPGGYRSKCRACTAVDTRDYLNKRRATPRQYCKVCGGSIQAGNRFGICRRNPECTRLNTALANQAKRRARGVTSQPCAACGAEWIRKKAWAKNIRLCPLCSEDKFWCAGVTAARAGHVAPLSVRAGGPICRACKLLNHARARAIRDGLPFALIRQHVESIFPEVCPYLGLRLERGIGKQHAASPTLDRIEPARGYVEGNVEVISYLANAMKNNATPDQLLTFAHAVVARHEGGAR